MSCSFFHRSQWWHVLILSPNTKTEAAPRVHGKFSGSLKLPASLKLIFTNIARSTHSDTHPGQLHGPIGAIRIFSQSFFYPVDLVSSIPEGKKEDTATRYRCTIPLSNPNPSSLQVRSRIPGSDCYRSKIE